MFPSKKDNYGIFCKKTYDFFNNSKDFKVVKISAIKGKSQNKYFNIFRYAFLLFDIFYNLVFKIDNFEIVYIQYVWKHAFFVEKFTNRLKKYNKKVFINFHGEDLTDFNKLSKNEQKSFKSLCDFSCGMVVPSNYFKNLLCKTVKILGENKIIVSPSGGIDSKIFFKSHKKDNYIIYCSRFDKDKGYDDFIYAVKNLEKKLNKKFLMLGYGKEIEKVKNLIKEISLENRIELIENPKQALIAEKYAQGSLFIFPTRLSESLGLAPLEAMSCGLSVISSNIGATSEYVEDGKNGFLYEAGNINQLTSKIEDFFNFSEEEQKKMRKNAIETANRYKDIEVELDFIRKINDFFNNQN